MAERSKQGFVPINDVEARIVRLMARGRSPAEIAYELDMASDHVDRVIRQLAERLAARRLATPASRGDRR